MTLTLAKQSARYLLGPDGPLAQAIPGYQTRTAQLDLTDAITAAIDDNHVLIAEAGTGIGKTFAYLIPAIVSHKKILIATGTKNLQDQLYGKDLPVITQNIVTGVKVALLKGRANYLCQYRLHANTVDAQFVDMTMVAHYQAVQTWAQSTRHGDISELNMIPEDAAIWPLVTSTSDNCLGSECEFYQECFLVNARREAQTADIVVINHHLFFADFALNQDKFSELLPTFDAVIFDEAHQLPEIASEFMGKRVTARQIQELCRDTLVEAKTLCNDMPDVVALIAQLQMRLLDMRYALNKEPLRGAWHSVCEQRDVMQAIDIVQHHLLQLTQQLNLYAGRSPGLQRCYERSSVITERFNLLTVSTPADQIHWFETFKTTFSIHHTPMSIATIFADYIKQQAKAFIFTSATLTIAKQFTHYQQAMGLTDAKTMCFESPFNYKQQALLYLPRYLPTPQHPDYVSGVVARAIPLIQAAQGRTFFLFTSYKNMHQAAEILAEQVSWPLLIQGSKPKRELLQAFRTTPHAVLLATHSFWEGIDVRGDALTCVIIDKIPFATPDDPITSARINALRQLGNDPFQSYQLPQAIISLRQGIGRLIRDQTDQGVIMLADPRIATKAYGVEILLSLPAMPITRDESTATAFLEKCYDTDDISA